MRNRNQQHVQVLELKAKGLSIRVIGDQLGISKSTVARMAQQKPTVPKRPNRDNSGTVPLNRFVPRKCAAKDCQREYRPVRKTQLYCSHRCKNREAQRRLVKRGQQLPAKASRGHGNKAATFQVPVIKDEMLTRLAETPPQVLSGLAAILDGDYEIEDEEKSDPWK